MFFDTNSLSESKLTMDHFKEWAGEIAGSFLNQGVSPNITLTKIAQVEELTPHQVQVLAGETNKVIHMQKYAHMKDKYFAADFPHADFKEVLKGLQVDGAEVKLAVKMKDPEFDDAGPDAHQMFGVEPEVFDKTASVKGNLKTASAKTELLHQKLKDKVLLGKYACESAERVFIKKARQFVLNGTNPSERMQYLGVVDHMAKEAGMELARPSLAKLAHVLREEGLVEPLVAKEAVDYFMSKEADQKAPEALISDWLDAKVINGQHPLYITLKTFNDSTDELRQSENRFGLVDDKVRILKQRIREL